MNPEDQRSEIGACRIITTDFPSKILEENRKVVIYLPPGYSTQIQKRFPVIYAQDGQNLFDPKTSAFGVDWDLDGAGNSGIATGKVQPFMAVGVYNSRHRFEEYTPIADARHRGGKASLYLKFLVEELKPYIDQHYHTSPAASDTINLGSSLGGLFALYAGWSRPDVFGKVAALSPSLWWAGRGLISAFGGVGPKTRLQRLYVDVGTRESNDDHNQNGVADVLDDLRTLRAVLVYHGYTVDHDLFYSEVTGAAHTEADWAKRVGHVLEVMLPVEAAS